KRLGDRGWLLQFLVVQAFMCIGLGRWDEVDRALDELDEMAPPPSYREGSAQARAWMLALRGHAEEADAKVREAATILEETDPKTELYALIIKGEVAAYAGRLEEAYALEVGAYESATMETAYA